MEKTPHPGFTALTTAETGLLLWARVSVTNRARPARLRPGPSPKLHKIARYLPDVHGNLLTGVPRVMESGPMRGMFRAVMRVGLLVVLAGALGPRAAGAEGGDAAARQQWMLGYLKAEQADQAFRAEQFALARQLYQEALQGFSEVGRRFPDWNPDLVRYRTAHCTDQLRRLDEAVAAALDRMGRADLVAEVRRLRDLRQGEEARVQAQTAAAEHLQKALDTALLEGRKADAEATRLKAELEQAQAKGADLAARLDTVTRDLQAREADLNRLQAAVGDAVSLRDRLAELSRQAEAASRSAQEAESARAQAADLEARLRQAEAREAALRTDLDRARREGDAVRVERENEIRSRRDLGDQAATAETARRKAEADALKARQELQTAQDAQAAAATRQAAAAAQVATLTEALAATERDRDALKAEAAALRDEARALKAEDVTRLREAHAEALRRIEALTAAAERDGAALKGAQETVQRLTSEKESQARAAQEAAAAERRRRTDIVQAEAEAAKAIAAGDTAAAEAGLRRVLDLAPQDARAAARLGALLVDRGEVAAALPYLEAARRALPDDPDVLLRLGATQLRQGQATAAAATLLQATQVASGRADLCHLAGVALTEAGSRDLAERQFLHAFELDGRRADTAYCLAALLASATPPRRQEARAWYDRALGLGAARDAGLDRFFADDR